MAPRLQCFLVVGILLSITIPEVIGHGHRGTTKRALYFLDNNVTGVSIISLKIAEKDGHLSSPTRIPTGGKGIVTFMQTLFSLGAPLKSVQDSTFSQNPIIVDGNVSSFNLTGLQSVREIEDT